MHQRIGELFAIIARRDQRIAVGQLDAVDPGNGKHLGRSALPVDRGNEEIRLGGHRLGQFGGRRRLAPQVEFTQGPALEGLDHQTRAQSRQFAAHRLDLRRGPLIGVDRPREFLLDARPQHLDRDLAAIGGDGTMDLGDRRGADRDRIDRLEKLRRVAAERSRHRGVDRLVRNRRQRILQAKQVVRRDIADDIGPSRQRLAKLDRGRTDRLQRIGIGRHLGHAGAEPGDARQAAHRYRRVGIALDTPQRAVACEDAAPFEEAPEMDCGGGHEQLDLPAAMDRDQPAQHRLDLGLHEAGLGNHALELFHVGKTADRFDKIAIAILILGQELADLGYDFM